MSHSIDISILWIEERDSDQKVASGKNYSDSIAILLTWHSSGVLEREISKTAYFLKANKGAKIKCYLLNELFRQG